ncbi:ABC transporter ATP-binding protein [Eubacterium sp. AM05-23]|nr:ABC transporter ATP-binding protein [Eubacterium sp. AM05-23]
MMFSSAAFLFGAGEPSSGRERCALSFLLEFLDLKGMITMSLLEVKDLSHSYGDKVLYHDASFELYNGEHMGLVGQNGAGKSTLIKTLIGEVIPDDGLIKWFPKASVGHLDQYAQVDAGITVFEYLKQAYADLYRMEERLNGLYEKMAEDTSEKLINQAANLQETLEDRDFYSIESHIYRVAAGLGITAIGMDKVLEKLSGGQRAKVILAKLLLEKPEVLLLDEPTNFLDKEHVEWLSKYLTGFEGAFILVSHDFDFLDQVTTCIGDIEFGTITKYHGNYSAFLKQKGQKREEYIRQYESQKKFIERTEEYIAKNKVRASTAAMAKSRQKKLDKIERMAPPTGLTKPMIRFKSTGITAQRVLEVKDLEVGYYYPLLPKLHFVLEQNQRVVITGFNGIGKSTLLKTLIGEILPISGSFEFARNVVIGYYEQDLKWEREGQTPLEIITEAFPKLSQKQTRSALSRCGVKAEHVLQPITTLSGGEQSRVKLCKLTLSPCNLLILDEPTNHLDYLAKESLQEALQDFDGTVILVSHEAAFYRDWADKVLEIEKMGF